MNFQLSNEQMLKIAEAMVNGRAYPGAPPISQCKAKKTGNYAIPAGYTYIGQLIAHDLVQATDGSLPETSPFLDLESVFGSQCLDNNLTSSYSIREVRSLNSSIVGYDLPRKKVAGEYIAQIPDKRNDDNVIISQLHALLLKLYNLILAKGMVNSPLEAKEIVVLLFQKVTVDDFLTRILHPTIFKHYFENHSPILTDWNTTKMPAFFSHAAFRFGHSLVRPEYSLRPSEKRIATQKLFRSNKQLTGEFVTDFTHLFDTDRAERSALHLDTLITKAMSMVNFRVQQDPIINVVRRNLEASQHVNLPSGQQMYERVLSASPNGQLKRLLRSSKIKSLEGSCFHLLGNSRKHTILLKHLPLWPYILLESERTKGISLGVLGSVLVAEGLYNAIKYASSSIFTEANKLNRFLTQLSITEPSKITMQDVLTLITKLENNHD